MGIVRDLIDNERPLSIKQAGSFNFKNRIINGGFNIWQRGENYAYGVGVSGYHTADRFNSNNSTDGQYTISKSNIDGKNSIKFNTDVPSTDLTTSKYWYGLLYKFEGQHLYDLYIQKYNITISFLFKSNVSGNFSVSLRNWTVDISGNRQDDSYVTTFYYDGSEISKRIEITIPLNYNFQNSPKNDENVGFVIAIGFLNQGNFITSTTNQWQVGNYLTTSDCVNWGATSGNYFEIAELQLEEGDYATDFEYVPYDIEFMRCMRYYQVVKGTCPVLKSADDIRHVHTLPVQMRAVGTTIKEFYATTSNTDITTGYPYIITNKGYQQGLFFAVNSTGTLSRYFQFAIDAEL